MKDGAPAGGMTAASMAVAAGRCINLRGRLEACDLCRRACHADAFTLSIDEVAVDENACVDCGACVPACPADALSLPGFEPEAFVAALVGRGLARVACAAVSRPGEADAVIPCHKMLDARLLAALRAEGVERVALLGLGRCGACPSGDARPALKSARATLKKWLGEAAPRLLADTSEREDAAAADDGGRAARRRALLRRAGRVLAPPPEIDVLADLDVEAADAAPRPAPYQHALAERRAGLPFREGGPVGATTRGISEACTGCLVCAELCPTGALRGSARAEGVEVSFDPALCTNCTLCQKVCPMDAITARAVRGVDEAMAGRAPLHVSARILCAQCGAPFPPGESGGEDGGTLCAVCANEQEMDDEWDALLEG